MEGCVVFMFDPFATSENNARRWVVPREQSTTLERLQTKFGGRPLQDFGHDRGCWAVVCVKHFSVVHHLGFFVLLSLVRVCRLVVSFAVAPICE